MSIFERSRRFLCAAALSRSARVLVGACVVATLVAGCKTGPGSFHDKFGVGTGNARVSQFYFSGLGMDHAYLWVIEPFDDQMIAAIVEAARLRPRQNRSDGASLSSEFPAWWDSEAIEQLPEGYFRNGPRQFWRVWIDRSSNRVYAQWFDT